MTIWPYHMARPYGRAVARFDCRHLLTHNSGSKDSIGAASGGKAARVVMSEAANMPDRYAIRAAMLYPGGGSPALADQLVEIEAGQIVGIGPAGASVADTDVDAEFDIVAPGFIDLQINGAGGVMFNDTPDTATIARMAAAARSGGTCHLLPTYITAPETSYETALAAVAAWDGPEVLGIHLEGPFLSPAKPGIHPAEHIRPMDDDDLALLLAHRGRVLLTLAPEEASVTHMARLAEAGVILFAGHSNAARDVVHQAAAQGLRGVTHIFNACSQITARDPGLVGAAFADPRLAAGIIADGHHVAPENLRMAHDLMKGRLCLVSDTMPTFGSDITGFEIGGVRISLKDGRLQSDDGVLAGAHLGLDRAVRVMVEAAGIERADALHMASGVPAGILGLGDRYGVVAAGHVASLTCLDADLYAKAVIVAGTLYR